METNSTGKIDDRFSRAWKKNLKFIHVLFAGGVFGSLAAGLAILSYDSDQSNIISAIHPIIEFVFLPCLYGLLGTGFLFSLYTGRGFVRSTWIIWKWIGATTLLTGALWFLSPDASGLSAFAATNGRNIELFSLLKGRFLFVTLLFSLLTVFLYYISFKKPWKTRQSDPISENPLYRKILIGFLFVFLLIGILQTFYLASIRNNPPVETDLSELLPGTYTETVECGGARFTATLYRSETGLEVKMEASHSSDFFTYATRLIPIVEQEKRVPVDAITGATTTSVCLMNAIRAASLAKPGN